MPSSKKIVVTTSDKEVPLVTFAHGKVKDTQKRKMKVSALHDTSHKGPGKRRKVLVAESDKLAYRGDNFGPLSAPEQSTELYVAEVNKTTGHMTLFPAQMFHLHPEFQGEVQREGLELESMSFGEKADLLTDAFGSRKEKRAVQQRQRSKVAEKAVTSAMGSALDLALTTHQAQPATDPQASSSSSAIPPHNKDAQTAAEVYSLHHIIGPVELDSLVHAAEVFMNCSSDTLRGWTETKEYPLSVVSRLRVMPLGEQQRGERACLLMYLHYMITLFRFKSDQIKKRDPLPEKWPDAVKRMMLDRFTVKMDSSRRCMPARVKDLLLSHMVLLCLMMDGFTTPLAHLLKDLNISVNRLHNHVRALGCRVRMDSSNKDVAGVKVTTSEAVLTVPLVFPEPSKPKKARTK